MTTDNLLECFYARLNRLGRYQLPTEENLTVHEVYAIYALNNVTTFMDKPSKNSIKKALNRMTDEGTLLKRKNFFRLSNRQKVIARLEGKI